MARLVSYKTRDENRYSTFANEPAGVMGPSNENISNINGFQLMANYKRPPAQTKSRNLWPKSFFCSHSSCPKFCHHKLLRLCCCSCCCSGCKRWCTCCGYCSLDEDDDVDNDSDDIDGKFVQIKYELGMKEINSDSKREASTTGVNGKAGQADSEACNRRGGASSNRWNWDDSLRSNSDKFLETLELDETADGERSFRRKLKVPRIRISSKFGNIFRVT